MEMLGQQTAVVIYSKNNIYLLIHILVYIEKHMCPGIFVIYVFVILKSYSCVGVGNILICWLDLGIRRERLDRVLSVCISDIKWT